MEPRNAFDVSGLFSSIRMLSEQRQRPSGVVAMMGPLNGLSAGKCSQEDRAAWKTTGIWATC